MRRPVHARLDGGCGRAFDQPGQTAAAVVAKRRQELAPHLFVVRAALVDEPAAFRRTKRGGRVVERVEAPELLGGHSRRAALKGGSKPRRAEANVFFDGLDADVQDGGDLGHLQSAEELQFHRARLARVHVRQLRQRFVESEEIHRLRLTHRMGIVERHQRDARAALGRAVAPRVVDQNLAHVVRGNGHEM